MSHSQKIILFADPAPPKRTKKMRTRRLKVEELKLGPLAVRFHHAGLGIIDASVDDLSLHGLAVVIAGGPPQNRFVLAGDRLDSLRLTCADGDLYEGNGVVRRVAERGGDLVLGVELDAGGIDLARLYRSGAR